jgi:hypothetical protein
MTLLGPLIFLTMLVLCFPGVAKVLAIFTGAIIFAFLAAGASEAIGLVPFLLLCLVVQGIGR